MADAEGHQVGGDAAGGESKSAPAPDSVLAIAAAAGAAHERRLSLEQLRIPTDPATRKERHREKRAALLVRILQDQGELVEDMRAFVETFERPLRNQRPNSP